MKKLFVILIILVFLTSVLYAVAKPPLNHGKDKPDNPNKGKGKKNNDIDTSTTFTFHRLYFGGNINNLINGSWSGWSDYWKITQLIR